MKVLLRRGPVAVVCLAGRTTTGRVVRVERSEAGHVRLRLAFRTADGREVEYLEPIAVRASEAAAASITATLTATVLSEMGALGLAVAQISGFLLATTLSPLSTPPSAKAH
ncbi:MAG TPA: hypothetical protein VE198_08650 [Actinoallomurus sp.]|nr:hypothetical protein [Actinoallomurus sp.]